MVFWGVEELKEDFDCPYGDRLVNSILKSVTKEYRTEKLQDKPYSVLQFSNFPSVVKIVNEQL